LQREALIGSRFFSLKNLIFSSSFSKEDLKLEIFVVEKVLVRHKAD
jgi:hypothetical protein